VTSDLASQSLSTSASSESTSIWEAYIAKHFVFYTHTHNTIEFTYVPHEFHIGKVAYSITRFGFELSIVVLLS